MNLQLRDMMNELSTLKDTNKEYYATIEQYKSRETITLQQLEDNNKRQDQLLEKMSKIALDMKKSRRCRV